MAIPVLDSRETSQLVGATVHDLVKLVVPGVDRYGIAIEPILGHEYGLASRSLQFDIVADTGSA